jgi:hypothetical protein
VLVAGLACAAVGTALVPVSPGLEWMVLPLVVYGVGQVAAVNAGGDVVLRRGGGSSQAIGQLRLSSDLGLVIGPIAAGALADWLGYGAPFAMLPVLMLIATGFAAFALTRHAPHPGGRVRN